MAKRNDFSNEDLGFIIRDLEADLNRPNITPKRRQAIWRMMRNYEKQLKEQDLSAKEKRLRIIVRTVEKRTRRSKRIRAERVP